MEAGPGSNRNACDCILFRVTRITHKREEDPKS
jgi:hypothetical protein